MISFKCKNCGGEMSIARSGDLSCPYCGTKVTLSDTDLAGYKEFRKKMLEYLREAADHTATAEALCSLWDRADTMTLTQANGESITIRYIYATTQDGVTMYSARNTLLLHFPKEQKADVGRLEGALKLLRFPAADIKDLPQCFPKVLGAYDLADGGEPLAVAKSEDFYPLGIFGQLIPQHAEWILSRLENIACVLEYSGMSHGGITLEDVFINPATHEAKLLGGWERAGRMSVEESLTPRAGKGFAYGEKSFRADLISIREVVKRVMGEEYGAAPEPVRRFLESKPEADAYKDFARWDEVIEKELGGRHFTKFMV